MEDRGRPGLNNPAIRARLSQTHRRVGSAAPTLRPSQPVVPMPQLNNTRPTNPSMLNIVTPQPFTRPAHPKLQQSKVLRRQSVRKPFEIAVSYDPEHVEVTRPFKTARNIKPKIKLAGIGLVALGLLVGVGGIFNAVLVRSNQSSQVANVEFADIEQSSDPSIISELKPTANALSGYSVPADDPKILTIPKLYVYARIKPVGLSGTNQLNLTSNIFDAGWLNVSGKPGMTDKNVIIINGHSSGPNQVGLFAKLLTLTVGDSIKVTRGDGQPFVYSVVRVQTVDAGNTDPSLMSMPGEPGKAGLNLVGCDENLSTDIGDCRQQVIVFASKSS